MVTRAHLQPDHVREDLNNMSRNKVTYVHSSVEKSINNQYPSRFVYNQSSFDLNILKQEILATRTTFEEWPIASDRYGPMIPGKSYAEVLKTDLQSQCKKSVAKNRVTMQQGRIQGKLAGWGHIIPIKSQRFSSDSPACINTAKVNVKVAPDHLQEPVAVTNRFTPLFEVDEFGQEVNVIYTLYDINYEFSDLECNLAILDSNLGFCLNVTNYDSFDKKLLKKTSGSESASTS